MIVLAGGDLVLPDRLHPGASLIVEFIDHELVIIIR